MPKGRRGEKRPADVIGNAPCRSLALSYPRGAIATVCLVSRAASTHMITHRAAPALCCVPSIHESWTRTLYAT